MAYCDISSGTLKVMPGPRAARSQVPFATTQLLEALLAVRYVFDPRPWRDELREALAEYRAVTDLVRAQDGLSVVDWTQYVDID